MAFNIYDINMTVVARWHLVNRVKGIAFNRNSVNRRLYIAETTGEILVLSFNCTRVVCAPEFYMDATGCRFCGDVIPKCISCFNGTVCDKCLDGFYLSAMDYKCKVCPIFGCLTCNSPTNCLECHSGFYIAMINGVDTCKRCTENASATILGIEGCAVCSSNSVCIGCNNDYYLDGTVCRLCSVIANCLKCNNGTVCN
jgi:hypothetical protein